MNTLTQEQKKLIAEREKRNEELKRKLAVDYGITVNDDEREDGEIQSLDDLKLFMEKALLRNKIKGDIALIISDFSIAQYAIMVNSLNLNPSRIDTLKLWELELLDCLTENYLEVEIQMIMDETNYGGRNHPMYGKEKYRVR